MPANSIPLRSGGTDLRTLTLLVALLLTGCASTHATSALHPQALTAAEHAQVDALLETLYAAFNYGAGEEPNWAAMRSVFVDGAPFVTEVPAGQAPRPLPIDGFIASWQASIRGSTSPGPGYAEWITDTRRTKVGRLIRVDVSFLAERPGDPSPRKPGLDSLVLAHVGGAWKVLSFVVQYESKL